MTIFNTLGDDFLKLTLSEKEYKKLIAREGREPVAITTTLRAAMDMHNSQRIVKAIGNTGHVYVPKEWIGKTVLVTLVN